MPLLKFHLHRGRSEAEICRILDVAHQAMLRSFQVPERDRYQIVFEHEPSHLQALDTGLGLQRTNAFLLLEVTSRPRSRDSKAAFYEQLCRDLKAQCDIPPSDLMVTFTENADEDWSFGDGRAQFLTGELKAPFN